MKSLLSGLSRLTYSNHPIEAEPSVLNPRGIGYRLELTSDDFDTNGRLKKSTLKKNFDEITEVICSYVSNVKELPLWPNVQYVNCCVCKNLKILPPWPNVTTVLCNQCSNLINLPDWPNIRFIECSFCPLLTSLPLWPDVTFRCENEKIYQMLRKLDRIRMILISSKTTNQDMLRLISQSIGKTY